MNLWKVAASQRLVTMPPAFAPVKSGSPGVSSSSVFAPAQTVTIRSHVPREGLLSANSLMQMAFMGMRIVGPAMAGALVATFGATLCYSVDVVSFLGSAALIGSVGIRRAVERSVKADSGQGPIAKLAWSRHRSRVRGLVLCATANHFFWPEARGIASAIFPGIIMAARVD